MGNDERRSRTERDTPAMGARYQPLRLEGRERMSPIAITRPPPWIACARARASRSGAYRRLPVPVVAPEARARSPVV
jgi:hypothetical protein